jgi:hypothetical protein
MSKYSLNLDPNTGQFLPIPKGQKPPKMLDMEKNWAWNLSKITLTIMLTVNLGKKDLHKDGAFQKTLSLLIT